MKYQKNEGMSGLSVGFYLEMFEQLNKLYEFIES